MHPTLLCLHQQHHLSKLLVWQSIPVPCQQSFWPLNFPMAFMMSSLQGAHISSGERRFWCCLLPLNYQKKAFSPMWLAAMPTKCLSFVSPPGRSPNHLPVKSLQIASKSTTLGFNGFTRLTLSAFDELCSYYASWPIHGHSCQFSFFGWCIIILRYTDVSLYEFF